MHSLVEIKARDSVFEKARFLSIRLATNVALQKTMRKSAALKERVEDLNGRLGWALGDLDYADREPEDERLITSLEIAFLEAQRRWHLLEHHLDVLKNVDRLLQQL